MEVAITLDYAGAAIVVGLSGEVNKGLGGRFYDALVAFDEPLVFDVTDLKITSPTVALAIKESVERLGRASVAIVSAREDARDILKRWAGDGITVFADRESALLAIGNRTASTNER